MMTMKTSLLHCEVCRATYRSNYKGQNPRCIDCRTPELKGTLPDFTPRPATANAPLLVGTYNLLHPTYAEKYDERPGIGADGRSNWAVRAPELARVLIDGELDVYLLQEVCPKSTT